MHSIAELLWRAVVVRIHVVRDEDGAGPAKTVGAYGCWLSSQSLSKMCLCRV
jgi:hypothetical protein